MRRRTRHASIQGEPPAKADAGTQSDARLDEALLALARLLARQAAREIFERERGEEETCSDHLP